MPMRHATTGGTRVYATRNNAFTPETRWILNGANLWQEAEGSTPRLLPLVQLAGLRLDYAPTRMEPHRYRCRLLSARGETKGEFFNRRYAGVAEFKDTSSDYAAFVSNLLAACVDHAPHCRVQQGGSMAGYVFNVLAYLVGVIAVLLVLGFALTVGLWWLVLVKAALIVFYLPRGWRWLQRNRPRTYALGEVPERVLPG
jgi:hypothetical protein